MIKKKMIIKIIMIFLFSSNYCFANENSPLSFTWVNILANSPSYNESGASIIALTSSYGSNLFFSNTYPPHVSGARNVWMFDDINFTNLSLNMNNYEHSAPSALHSDGGSITIGHYSGLVQQCTYSNCINLIRTGSSALGVTDVLNIGYTLYAGYSDKNTGDNGKFLMYQYGQLLEIQGINSGVGKFTTNGEYIFIPTKLNGLIRMSTSGYNLGDVSPQLSNNEYITVAYYSYNDYQHLYIGTSNANIYKVRLPVYPGDSWVKINSAPLSNTSSIAAMVLDNQNNLYAGLANLNSYTNGGELFILPNNGANFVKENTYTDTSSITSMLLYNNHVYIGTFAGAIWHN